jgi:NTE family protein
MALPRSITYHSAAVVPSSRRADGQYHDAASGGTPLGADQKPVNMALQGGGAHGAFAWGVLDKLLEDGRLTIDAMSATSAGAMNAVVAAYGLSIGGPDGARGKLDEFWRHISNAGQLYSPVRSLPWETWPRDSGPDLDFSPTFFLFQAMTHVFSPYQINPFNLNPLKSVLSEVVDFDRLAKCNRAPRLFLSATNVRTGKIKVFDNDAISVDVVLASACLPYLFHAVEIDGEHYWDGGFMGNPAIFPLIYNRGSKDVILIHINPIERKKLPRTAAEIFNRVNEISMTMSSIGANTAACLFIRSETTRRWPSSELRPSSIQIGTSCVACAAVVAQRRPSGWTPISTRSGNRRRSI